MSVSFTPRIEFGFTRGRRPTRHGGIVPAAPGSPSLAIQRRCCLLQCLVVLGCLLRLGAATTMPTVSSSVMEHLFPILLLLALWLGLIWLASPYCRQPFKVIRRVLRVILPFPFAFLIPKEHSDVCPHCGATTIRSEDGKFCVNCGR
jgi:hypothetical protein